jgi:hypothetical protein
MHFGMAHLHCVGFGFGCMKGFRWYASSLMALIELPTFAALFVAGMSVAGDWL